VPHGAAAPSFVPRTLMVRCAIVRCSRPFAGQGGLLQFLGISGGEQGSSAGVQFLPAFEYDAVHVAEDLGTLPMKVAELLVARSLGR